MKWSDIKDLKWKDRNAAVEAALRAFLTARLETLPPLSTTDLANALSPGDSKEIAKVLVKLAPWMGALATHDGAVFFAHGRKMQRWQWRGQRSAAPATTGDSNGKRELVF
jgi:hypothetical protein